LAPDSQNDESEDAFTMGL